VLAPRPSCTYATKETFVAEHATNADWKEVAI
jgi:hypothetical protein